MPKILDTFPTQHPRAIYNWADVDDGRIYEVVCGFGADAEYQVAPRTYVHAAHRHAETMGIRLRTAIRDNVVTLQFVHEERDPRGRRLPSVRRVPIRHPSVGVR